ncbi:uncharacterized protein si:ch1073-291c23.2 isoform X2 [Chelmon rostratus]|uniref:uncharacterized protein si:ch1073-291c23.2 isoform X2 n=1 Tax=Chelmon rostratus TaxID=109905 RepID=UPI001BECA250|nr:uncharacterized protein si:ch1073-291c23.2 isoform X2 [Chelmon rostratus]
MSAELISASGNNASLQGTTVGGSKPLHRFMKGQPKSVGLILCGILYIVTEHNPTKKTVTISLALSIVTLLGTCWSILRIIPDIAFYHHSYYYNIHYEFLEDNITESEVAWQSHHEAMGMSIAAIYLFYSIVSAIILIVMSTLAGSALRSTKSQAIVVMTTTATEEPVE